MNLQRISRYTVLGIARNEFVSRLVHRHGMKWGVLRFVAGETPEDGLRVAEELNQRGLQVTLSNLGEGVKRREQVEEDFRTCRQLLDEYGKRSISGHISVKVSRLGIDIDRALCVQNLESLAERAAEVGSFVRINMEEYPRVEQTLDVFHDVISRRGTDHLGAVIQSGLRRSEQDIRKLADVGANVRLVKGSFNESAEVAFTSKAEVDENFYRLAVMLLDAGSYTAIATHDEKLIDRLKKYTRERRIPNDQFEWQMLYGIRPDLQNQLAAEGYTVRVYVPFGPEWYAFFSRRLAERPANIAFVLKNLLKGA